MNELILDNLSEDVIYALAASPHFATDKLCYAARQSGLWVSDDGGATWRSAFESLGVPSLPSATAVALSPHFQSDRTVFVGVPGGLLTTSDGGASWITAALPTPAPFITSLVVSPDYAQDGVVLAGSMEDGVFVSEDRGRSWKAWNFGLLDQNIFCIALSPNFAHDQRVYVGTESGIYTSKNRGHSWRAIPFPAEFSPVLSMALSPRFALDGRMWVGTEAHGLFYSADYGATWESAGLTGSVNSIIISPRFPEKPDILIMLDDDLLVARDGGQHWIKLDLSQKAATHLITVIAPLGLEAGANLLLGSEDGSVSNTQLTEVK